MVFRSWTTRVEARPPLWWAHARRTGVRQSDRAGSTALPARRHKTVEARLVPRRTRERCTNSSAPTPATAGTRILQATSREGAVCNAADGQSFASALARAWCGLHNRPTKPTRTKEACIWCFHNARTMVQLTRIEAVSSRVVEDTFRMILQVCFDLWKTLASWCQMRHES
jgi:hypothetical protein